MKVVSSTTPLRERALCQFEYILNYKPNVAVFLGDKLQEIIYPTISEDTLHIHRSEVLMPTALRQTGRQEDV